MEESFIERISMVIYKITNPNGRVYVGQTLNWSRRLKEYKLLYKSKEQTGLHNSFKKYGVDSHKFEILEELHDEGLLNERERFYQEKYNVLGENGLNCRYVSSDDKTGRWSEESKRKLSESMKGKKKTEKHRKSIGLSKKGKPNSKLKGRTSPKKGTPLTEEHKLRISESKSGYKHTQVTKDKISNTKTGVPSNRTPEGKKSFRDKMVGRPSPNRKKLYDNRIEKEFHSLTEWMNHTSTSSTVFYRLKREGVVYYL